MSLQEHKDISLERLIFFSDAVFAIAITILSLEIRLPEGANVKSIFHDLTPSIIAYIFGFVQIAIFWTVHHTLFKKLINYDFKIVWLNFVFLMVVAFIPVPVSTIIKLGINAYTITFMYACLTLLGIVELCFWQYITSEKKNFTHTSLTKGDKKIEQRKILVLIGIFLVGIPLAFLNAYLAVLLSLCIPLIHSIIKIKNKKR
jgi:uncharacterized membrane protein